MTQKNNQISPLEKLEGENLSDFFYLRETLKMLDF